MDKQQSYFLQDAITGAVQVGLFAFAFGLYFSWDADLQLRLFLLLIGLIVIGTAPHTNKIRRITDEHHLEVLAHQTSAMISLMEIKDSLNTRIVESDTFGDRQAQWSAGRTDRVGELMRKYNEHFYETLRLSEMWRNESVPDTFRSMTWTLVMLAVAAVVGWFVPQFL